MTLRALTWNLFHGRDHPPDPALGTWRSRLLRLSERGATHAQVNRDLRDQFAALLAARDWDVALLQECPPRWSDALAAATGAQAHRALTSRNSLAPLRSALARLNPDLIASNEGGSNLTLVRGEIRERQVLELTPGPRPERRAMAATRAVPERFGAELWIANLHASAGAARRVAAEGEVERGARLATRLAAGGPLLFGGDLNLRPRDSEIFGLLAAEFGLEAPTAPGSLDHLLVAGLSIAEPAAALPGSAREVAVAEGLIRLSDHAPVIASFA